MTRLVLNVGCALVARLRDGVLVRVFERDVADIDVRRGDAVQLDGRTRGRISRITPLTVNTGGERTAAVLELRVALPFDIVAPRGCTRLEFLTALRAGTQPQVTPRTEAEMLAANPLHVDAGARELELHHCAGQLAQRRRRRRGRARGAQ